ncbi:MAG: DUF5069 domain-containing protein [Verrucomicrobiota bacterium JB022]|nr:DUF5069 domain-containing protein [Verrucomicrobiota bacterium JB022]
MSDAPLGPTGEICRDLPSPYQADPTFGLLHLPRFLAKIRKHLAGELPQSYRKNFCRGFDRFLCLHLGIDPKDVVAAVEAHGNDEAALYARLQELFPAEVKAAQWNREVTHKGQTEAGREFLAEALEEMGTPERVKDIVCVCDLIDFDEGRIPGYDPALAAQMKAERQGQPLQQQAPQVPQQQIQQQQQ